MADLAIIDQDTVKFGNTYGSVDLLVPQTGKMTGSGPATYKTSKKICVEGDEAKVVVPGCTFKGKNHNAPGTGTLKIKELDGKQVAEKTKIGGKPIILKGSKFKALLIVMSPPTLPNGNPDTSLAGGQLEGTGEFITTNTHYKVT